jgi:hypothetical protein
MLDPRNYELRAYALSVSAKVKTALAEANMLYMTFFR